VLVALSADAIGANQRVDRREVRVVEGFKEASDVVFVVVFDLFRPSYVVAATDLVASLPASLLNVLGSRPALRRVTAPVPALATTINLLWHERTHRDPALPAFRELLLR
jgi:DNA-binding transcriptional LysR family regulator